MSTEREWSHKGYAISVDREGFFVCPELGIKKRSLVGARQEVSKKAPDDNRFVPFKVFFIPHYRKADSAEVVTVTSIERGYGGMMAWVKHENGTRTKEHIDCLYPNNPDVIHMLSQMVENHQRAARSLAKRQTEEYDNAFINHSYKPFNENTLRSAAADAAGDSDEQSA